ncbi:MAG: glycosyltransferase family 39 protein [Flavobacteriales bacterium]|nr:glycosyltransferase family 39 protein [Flavobacteriales bacterium]
MQFFENRGLSVLILFIVSFLCFSSGINLTDIYFLDEAKNAVAGREMLGRSSLFVPTFNGVLRGDKPPFHYFMMMISYSVFGVSPFSARIFSAVFGMMTVLCLYLFSRKYIGNKYAFFSSLLLISSLHFTIQMHWSVPDPYFVFFTTLSGLSFIHFYTENKRIWWWMFYISLGISVLCKGPAGIILIGFGIFVFLLLNNDFKWKTIMRINPFLGIFISLLICIPWFWVAHNQTKGAFTELFFFRHNIERFTGEMEGHGGLFLLTLVFVILGLLPYVFFLFNYRVLRDEIKKNVFLLFSFSISVAIIMFFMFSGTKLPNYTVPSYPWLYILISVCIFKTSKKLRKQYLIAILVFTILLPIAVFIGIKADKVIYDLEFLSIFFLIPTLGSVYALFNRNSEFKWIYGVAFSWITMGLVLYYIIFPKVDAYNPVAKTYSLFKQNETIVGYQLFNSAYVFKFKKVIPVIQNEQELKSFIEKNPKGGKIITRFNDETKKLKEKFQLKEVAKEKDLFENPTTYILEF